MPNIEMLFDSISQHLTNTQNGEQAYFSTLDLYFSYSYYNCVKAPQNTNINIICGKSTGTYRFKTGFYGFSDKPAEFQKAMDYTHFYLFLS